MSTMSERNGGASAVHRKGTGEVGGVVLQDTIVEQESTVVAAGGEEPAGAMQTDLAPGMLQLQHMESENKTGREISRAASAAKLSSCSELRADCNAYVGATAEGPAAGGHKRPQAKLGMFPVSRWVVFLLYCCYCLLAGPSFLNWTTIADMLYRGDAFLWECAPGTIGNPPPKPQEAKCPAQELAVNNLFSVASCSYFVFAMLGGVILDYAGPKLGALSGLGCLVLGWMLLAFSSEGFRAYVPAMVFMGAGIDMAFFPCLCGANLFPGFTATIIALYGACRSISFVAGLALREIFFNVPGATLRSTLLGYVGVGLGFCITVALLIIPWTAWPPQQAEEEGSAGTAKKTGEKVPEENQEVVQLKNTSGEDRRSGCSLRRDSSSPLQRGRVTAGSCKDASVRQETAETESQLPHRHGETASTGADTGGAPADVLLLLQRDQQEGQDGAGVTHTATASEEECVREQRRRSATDDKVFQNENVNRRIAMLRQLLTSLKSFARDLVSPSFLPVIPYFVFVLIDILFFTPSAKRLIPDAYAANQIITVCGFAPCIVLGYLTDHIGIVRVMMICNSAGLLSWVLLLIPGIPCLTAFQYLASILFTVQMSFVVSQIYCYVTEMFRPENHGKLIGFLCSAGGIISLVTSPMRDYSVNNTFYPMVVLCLVLAAVNEGLLVFMFCWQRRTKRVKQERVALQERIAEEMLTV